MTPVPLPADHVLKQMLEETSRWAVLRWELADRKDAAASTCDGLIAAQVRPREPDHLRAGQGVYGIGNPDVFQIAPEVLPRPGYRLLPA